MYYFTKWSVLIVDDEPDVLTISRLALAGCEVYGLPLALHFAQTKAEAIEMLYEQPDLAMNMPVAFIDVVMETDAAGLELCDHIREDIGNRHTQLFIRTGQPGLAPERSVIDQYEINGYFTKIEATEDKLYALVKSGVRQFLWSHMAQLYLSGFNEVLNSADWHQNIERLLSSFVESALGASDAIPLYIAFDNQVLIQKELDAQQGIDLRATQKDSKGMRLSLTGDEYVHNGENLWRVQIVGSPTNAEVLLLCRTAFSPPEDLVTLTHDFFHGLATLWAHAGTAGQA